MVFALEFGSWIEAVVIIQLDVLAPAVCGLLGFCSGEWFLSAQWTWLVFLELDGELRVEEGWIDALGRCKSYSGAREDQL